MILIKYKSLIPEGAILIPRPNYLSPPHRNGSSIQGAAQVAFSIASRICSHLYWADVTWQVMYRWWINNPGITDARNVILKYYYRA